MDKPEALRLADELSMSHLSYHINHAAAAELRRLHAENEGLWEEREEPHKTIEMYVSECNRLESERDALKAQRDALLEALRSLLSYANVLEMRLLDADGEHRAMQQARAAIAKAEGEKA